MTRVDMRSDYVHVREHFLYDILHPLSSPLSVSVTEALAIPIYMDTHVTSIVVALREIITHRPFSDEVERQREFTSNCAFKWNHPHVFGGGTWLARLRFRRLISPSLAFDLVLHGGRPFTTNLAGEGGGGAAAWLCLEVAACRRSPGRPAEPDLGSPPSSRSTTPRVVSPLLPPSLSDASEVRASPVSRSASTAAENTRSYSQMAVSFICSPPTPPPDLDLGFRRFLLLLALGFMPVAPVVIIIVVVIIRTRSLCPGHHKLMERVVRGPHYIFRLLPHEGYVVSIVVSIGVIVAAVCQSTDMVFSSACLN